MKKYILGLGLLFLLLAPFARAQDAPVTTDGDPNEVMEQQEGAPQESLEPGDVPPDKFYQAVITEVIKEENSQNGSHTVVTQNLKVKFTNGDLKGQEKEILNDGIFTINGGKPLKAGQKVLVYKTAASGQEEFYIADTYRLPSLIIMTGIFLLLAVVLSRWKGFMSIVGLAISVLVIVKFIIPQVAAGKDPLLMCLIGALIIALVSIYLAHGFNKRTSVALLSTVLTLAIAAGTSILFVNMGKLFGLGSEEAFYVQQLGTLAELNLQGLLLGGIILGALGVLDDITTAQTASVYEIKRANNSLNAKELFSRGLVVGREHISSLVNTLFLAYAGASLPLFLFFTVGGATQPLWVTLNSEFIAEEVVRTLVGSIALILAVPISTFFAAYFFSKKNLTDTAPVPPAHVH